MYALLVAQYGLGFDRTLQYSYRGNATFRDVPTLFRVKDLPKWPDEEKYEYNWDTLKTTPDPYDYHLLHEIP